MNSMVSADMDFAQLDAFLTSQMKKRQVLKAATKSHLLYTMILDILGAYLIRER